jgi:hypothetical protein
MCSDYFIIMAGADVCSTNAVKLCREIAKWYRPQQYLSNDLKESEAAHSNFCSLSLSRQASFL